jgi:hypothetical protein
MMYKRHKTLLFFIFLLMKNVIYTQTVMNDSLQLSIKIIDKNQNQKKDIPVVKVILEAKNITNHLICLPPIGSINHKTIIHFPNGFILISPELEYRKHINLKEGESRIWEEDIRVIIEVKSKEGEVQKGLYKLQWIVDDLDLIAYINL